jgi:hypothetical protein
MGRSNPRRRNDAPARTGASTPGEAAAADGPSNSTPTPIAEFAIDDAFDLETDGSSLTDDYEDVDALIQNEVEAMENDVEAQLSEKDELIAALTAQLEETVERLDRLHRQGADRGVRTSGSGTPTEFLEEQRSLTERLNQWLDVWDNAQPLELWARLESRLEEIQIARPPAIENDGWPQAAPAAQVHRLEAAEPAAGASGWETAKQRILGELGLESNADEPAPPPVVAPQPIEPAFTPSVEYPAAVDFSTASREELCQAIDIRDRYISHLTHRLRSAEIRQPVNWEVLNEAPADLRQQLQDLEVRYREHLRREEVDLSLERARLAREQARLEQERHRFAQQLKRAGLTNETAPAGEMDEDDRSWRKMFGRKK